MTRPAEPAPAVRELGDFTAELDPESVDDAVRRLAGSGVTAILNGCSAVEVHRGTGIAILDPTRAALALLGAAHGSGLVPASGAT